MRKAIALMLALIVGAGTLFSQNLTPQKDEKKGKWGYVDEQGKWKIKPKYDSAEPFVEYRPKAQNSGNASAGAQSMPPEMVEMIKQEIQTLQAAGKNAQAEELLKVIGNSTPQNAEVRPEDILYYAFVKENGLLGMIDLKGRYIIPSRFAKIEENAMPGVDGGYIFKVQNAAGDEGCYSSRDKEIVPVGFKMHNLGNGTFLCEGPDRAILWMPAYNEILNLTDPKESKDGVFTNKEYYAPSLICRLSFLSDKFGHHYPLGVEYNRNQNRYDILLKDGWMRVNELFINSRWLSYVKQMSGNKVPRGIEGTLPYDGNKYIYLTEKGDLLPPLDQDGRMTFVSDIRVADQMVFIDDESYDMTSGHPVKVTDVINIKIGNRPYRFTKNKDGKYETKFYIATGGGGDLSSKLTLEDVKEVTEDDNINWLFLAKNDGKWSLYDLIGKPITDADENTKVYRLSDKAPEDLAVFTKGDKKGLVRYAGGISDYSFKLILPAEYDEIVPSTNMHRMPFANVKKDGKWYVYYYTWKHAYPYDAKWLSAKGYDEVRPAMVSKDRQSVNTLMPVENGKCGLLLLDGYEDNVSHPEETYTGEMTESVKPIYDSLSWNEDACLFDAVKNGKKMYVARQGKEVLDDTPFGEYYVSCRVNYSPRKSYAPFRIKTIYFKGQVDLHFLKDQNCKIVYQLMVNGASAGKKYSVTQEYKPWQNYAEVRVDEEKLDISALNLVANKPSQFRLGVKVTIYNEAGKAVDSFIKNFKFRDLD